MRCFLISDNADTGMGMRLAGVEGVIVHKREEALSALTEAVSAPDIAVVFITKKVSEMCRDEISEMKLTLKSPLITEIPDRHGDSHISETINGYVGSAIGVKM